MIANLGLDLALALRRLRQRPAFAALTVLTLALGVAGTAAVYGIAKRLLLAPLPYAQEEQVVAFWFDSSWSESGFAHVRPGIDELVAVAAHRRADATFREGDGPARLVEGVSASAELFEVLGVRPALGTGFRPGDDRTGAEPVAVLSHAFWRELGADPAIVGKRIELSGVARTIVGVAPAGFWFPEPTVRVWTSEEVDPENGAGSYSLVGRMAPGRTIASMGGQLERIARALDERFDFPEQWDLSANPELTPIRERLMGPVRPAVLALLGAMGVLLLVACVNVAALLLGQVDARGSELAVRSALGAGRGRILRQLAVESATLGALAGAVGAALAALGFRFLVDALPLGALAAAARIDWSLFAAAMAGAVVASTAVAFVPAAAIARQNLQVRLTRGRTDGVGGRGGRLEHALVVGQVALVLVLAAGAALLIRSVENRRAIDSGFDLDRVAVLDVELPATLDRARAPQVVNELVAAVATLPGVESAAVTQRLPMRGPSDNWGIVVESRPELAATTTAFRIVSPGYFEAMGIELVSGRGLEPGDRRADVEEGVVVVNRALAAKYFPGVDPVGQRIGYGGRWDRIVGVADDVAEGYLSPEPFPARYMVHEQVPSLLSWQTVVVRARAGVDPVALLEPARRALQAAQPSVAVRESTTLRRVHTTAIGPVLQVRSLVALLAGLALALGVVGVYGVVSHFVTRRRRDWGIRMALGLRPAEVAALIVRRSGTLLGAGVALGLVGFLLLSRLLTSFLYGVEAADPASLAAAVAVLGAAGLAAAALPARRAARVDPAAVLREP